MSAPYAPGLPPQWIPAVTRMALKVLFGPVMPALAIRVDRMSMPATTGLAEESKGHRGRDWGRQTEVQHLLDSVIILPWAYRQGGCLQSLAGPAAPLLRSACCPHWTIERMSNKGTTARAGGDQGAPRVLLTNSQTQTSILIDSDALGLPGWVLVHTPSSPPRPRPKALNPFRRC
jgi:hypothetical protein